MSIPQSDTLAQPVCAGDNVISIRIAVNPYFVRRLSKDAPDAVWYGFNAGFEHQTLTLSELVTEIQAGHAITAICRGVRKTDNYIAAQHIGIDFDTEDSRSSLDNLQSSPFVATYGAILHTTSSHRPEAPRARVIFILEQQITDPEQYSRYAIALNWYFGCSDDQCHDAARLWFGAAGCEVRKLGNVLPIAVLDDLVAQYEASQPPAPEFTPFVAVDVSTLLDEAVKRGTPGNRNHTGFWLACQLRDAGYDLESARDVVQTYQMAVETTGSHAYTLKEAIDSLSSAYKRKPRNDGLIDEIEQATITGQIKVSANVQKTLFALCEIVRQANSVEIDASLRRIAALAFVDKQSVSRHLGVLVEAGVIERCAKSDYRKASRYRMLCTKVRHICSGGNVPAVYVSTLRITLDAATTYTELQQQAICAVGARVHPELARDEHEFTLSFGSSAQRILAILAALPDGVDSLETLQELTHLSRTTVRNKISRLATVGIVETAKAGGQGNPLAVRLSPHWRDCIEEITPALTTFGQDILREIESAKQRIAHHDHMLRYAHAPAKRAISEATIAKAEQALQHYELHKSEANRQREDWAQRQGMDADHVPPISLHPIQRNKPRTERDPLKVIMAGRTLKPAGKVRTGKNGQLKSESADYIPPTIDAYIPLAENTNGQGVTVWTF